MAVVVGKQVCVCEGGGADHSAKMGLLESLVFFGKGFDESFFLVDVCCAVGVFNHMAPAPVCV